MQKLKKKNQSGTTWHYCRILTVLVEDRKHNVNDVIGKLYQCYRLRHMFQRGLIDGRPGNVVES